MELSELEPVTMSEVGTKLDLARAYMDMGDPDGARSILEEVVQEGSGSQKQEAQRLLDSIR
jgi:pilus assembly protein FimV